MYYLYSCIYQLYTDKIRKVGSTNQSKNKKSRVGQIFSNFIYNSLFPENIKHRKVTQY